MSADRTLTATRQWVLQFPAPARIVSSNEARRQHWATSSIARRQWRDATYMHLRRRRLPTGLDRVRVDVQVQFPDRRRRDAGNLHDQ